MGILEWIRKNISVTSMQEKSFCATETPCSIRQDNFQDIQIPPRHEEQPKFLSACREISYQNSFEAYFINGELYNVCPRNRSISLDEDRGTAYAARYIISDGIKYDLESPESISNIGIPKFNKSKGMPFMTRDLTYILNMHLKQEYRPNYVVPLAFKVANHMLHSQISWLKKDYFRLVIQLWLVGELEYGDFLLEELKKKLPFMTADNNFQTSKSFEEAMNFAAELKTDYIMSGHAGAICEKCAPYQDRIYSISGKTNDFQSFHNL